MKNQHLRAVAWVVVEFHLFKTSMILPMGDLWLMENEFLHQLRYVNSPILISGYLTMPYQLVWSPWFLPSRVTSRKGLFLQKSHLADRTQEVQQHSKGMELLKAAWEATGELGLEWWAQLSWWNCHGRFFFQLALQVCQRHMTKKTAESQMSNLGTWVTSSYQPHSIESLILLSYFWVPR